MSWGVKAQHVNMEIGHHIVLLENQETGGQHVLQIVLRAVDGCPHCGHIKPLDNLGQLDVPAIIAHEIANLEFIDDQLIQHAKKHQVPRTRSDGKIR